MIPPNVNAIIFNSVCSDSSVAALFLATLIPGIIWTLGYLVLFRFGYTKYYNPVGADADVADKINRTGSPVKAKKEKRDFVYGVIAAIGMPVIMMGGIYGGIFTSTEGGAIGCLYALVIGTFLFRKFTLKSAFGDFVNTGVSIGALMILFPMTYIFSRILTLQQVPSLLTNFILSISSNKYAVLIMIDLILFVAGFFVDCSVLQLVFVPLLYPLCKLIGVSATHLAVIVFVSIGVGTITPPMAMNLFITSRILKLPVKDVIQPIWPFVFFVGIPIMLLVTYCPFVSEWLPKLVLGVVT
jgi:C4-dicarboxylate transporter DctM subunit